MDEVERGTELEFVQDMTADLPTRIIGRLMFRRTAAADTELQGDG